MTAAAPEASSSRAQADPQPLMEPAFGWVEPARFDRINAARAPRDKARGHHSRGGQPPKLLALVRGLGVCARCDGKLRPQASHYKRKDGSRARKYVCENYAEGLCDQPPIDAAIVDPALVAYLDHFFIDLDAWQRGDDEAAGSRAAATERALAQARKRLEKLARQELLLRERWRDAMEAGEQRKEDAAFEALDDLRRERDATHARVQELEEALSAPADSTVDEALDLFAELARGLRGLSAERMAELSERLHEVFDRVELNALELAKAIRISPILRREVIERHGSDNTLMHLHAGHELEPRAMISRGDGWEMVSPSPDQNLTYSQESRQSLWRLPLSCEGASLGCASERLPGSENVARM